MSSEDECLSQRTAFHTAGSHKVRLYSSFSLNDLDDLQPIEVKQQSLARVAQILGAVGQETENGDRPEQDNEFEGDEIDDDLVFSTVPQRSFNPSTAQIHFDEIDDDEMRRFAESFEQEQQETKPDENDSLDMDDDQHCQERPSNMRTPIKSTEQQKGISIEDIDALLNDDDDDKGNDDNQMEQQEQMSPVFKKKA